MADLLILGHPPCDFWDLDAGSAEEVRWIMNDVIIPERNKKRS